MIIEIILFILFGAVAAISAIIMITRPNPVISAIFLILNFFSLAGLYLLLNAQFISVVQVIVYAGAIMVLFLFVLMLLNTKSEVELLNTRKKLKLFAVGISLFVFIQVTYLIFYSVPARNLSKNVEASIKSGTIEQIGREIYTNYILPFEISGFLLLATAIGALVLAKRKFK